VSFLETVSKLRFDLNSCHINIFRDSSDMRNLTPKMQNGNSTHDKAIIVFLTCPTYARDILFRLNTMCSLDLYKHYVIGFCFRMGKVNSNLST
jgi:hypothetical protein